MKHYVIIHEWANDYEYGVSVLGVAHSLEEAKEIFNNSVDDEKKYADEHGYEIFEDNQVNDYIENGEIDSAKGYIDNLIRGLQ